MRRHAKVTAIMPGRDKGWPTSQVMPMLLTTGAQSCTPTPIGNRLLTAGRMSSRLPCLQLPLTLKGRKTQMKVLTELPCLPADRTPPPCLSQSPETMPSPEAVTHLGLLGHPRNSLAKAGDRDTLYNWHWCVPCQGAGTSSGCMGGGAAQQRSPCSVSCLPHPPWPDLFIQPFWRFPEAQVRGQWDYRMRHCAV